MLFSDKIRAELLGGALSEHNGCLAGDCRGFNLALTAEKNIYNINVSASKAEDSGNAALGEYLHKTLGSDKRVADYEIFPNRINVDIRKAKKPQEAINAVMDPILDYLKANGYKSGCGECADSVAGLWQVKEEAMYLCPKCAKNLKKQTRTERLQNPRKHSKLLPGLLGALLGALIGAGCWVLLFRTGHTDGCGLAGLVMGLLAVLGYRILGKKLDVKGILCCIVVLAVTVYFANRLTWCIEGYLGLSGEYGWSFGDVYRDLRTILEGAEVLKGYYIQCALGYILAALMVVPFAIHAFRSASRTRVRKIK